MIEEAYFDEPGQPTRHKDGYAKWTAKYDERGNQIEWAYFDEAASPPGTRTASPGSPPGTTSEATQIEQAYFDESGRATRHKDGFASWTAKYDERGNFSRGAPTSTRPASPHGSRTATPRSPPGTTSGATVTEEAYFDEHGRPTRHKDGFAKLTTKYDERGNQNGMGLLRRGRPAHPAQGRLRQVHRPLRRAATGSRWPTSTSGKPTRHKDGFAKFTAATTSGATVTEVAYFDERRPAHPAQGRLRQIHCQVRRAGQRDRMGLLRRGRPAHPAQGRLRQAHRPLRRAGQHDRGAYFDEQGRPTRHKDGYAKFTASYDERGNRTEEAYFDEARPAHPAQGRLRQVHHQVRRAGQRDRVGLLRRGRPAHPAQGRLRQGHRQVRRAGQPDRDGPTSTRPASPPGTRTASPGSPPSTTSGATGSRRPTSTRPASPPGTRTATPRCDQEVRRAGQRRSRRPTSTRPAGPPGTRTASPSATAKYDERGNRTEVAYFDEARPAHPAQGRLRQAHRQATTSGATRPRRPTSTKHGQPTRHKDGYAKVTASYDERGNRIEAGLLRRARPAHPAQGRLRQVHRQVRRAGQPDRDGLLRRARPAHPAQGRLRQSSPPATTSGATRSRRPTSTSTAGPRGTRMGMPSPTAALRRAG